MSYLKADVKPILANLGFLLQISGFFTLPSIVYAYFLNDIPLTIALFISTLAFFCLGFPLNAICERKQLNLKQACGLLILFFIFIPLINSIPYLYLNIFNGSLFDQLINSWFETESAITTTGLTLLDGVPIPQPLILARSISEWVGGIGVVFMILSFFHPSHSLYHYAKVLGVEKIAQSYQKTFAIILGIYSGYTIVFSFLLMLAGLDAFSAFQTTFTIFSTTGLTLVNIFNLPKFAIMIVTIMMLFSGMSFVIHLNLVTLLRNINWKYLFTSSETRRTLASFITHNLKKCFSSEMKLYVILLFVFTSAFWLASDLSLSRSFFHILDFSSSCGLNLLNFQELGDTAKYILVIVMMIGPMSFSIGGGIRILRLHLLFKTFFTYIEARLSRKPPRVKLNGEYLEKSDLVIHMLIISLFILFTISSAFVLSGYGYSYVDGLIESASAISTTGDSPKVLTPSMPFIPKLVLLILMLLGRIEIVPLFIIFSKRVNHMYIQELHTDEKNRI
jgi:trk system potassium uptake protein TrkH